MKYTYGIVSTASITPRFVHAVQAYGDEVGAIASRSLEKAQRFAQEHTIYKAYGSYEELYKDPDIDVVYIATPNNTHVIEAMKALSYKKHVIIEKPFALTMEEAMSIYRYAKEQGCFVMEAQKSVFLPATQKIKECLDAQVLGSCHQILMLSSFPGSYPKDHWMYRSYGGVLYGSATYTIEYLMYLFDDPTIEISAICDEAESGAINDAGLHLCLADHRLVDSHITMKVNTHNEAIFYCEQGYIKVENYWKAREVLLHPYEGEEQHFSFPVAYEMVYEVAHIHECLDKKLLYSPIMTPERTILCTQMVDSLVQDHENSDV